MQEGHRN